MGSILQTMTNNPCIIIHSLINRQAKSATSVFIIVIIIIIVYYHPRRARLPRLSLIYCHLFFLYKLNTTIESCIDENPQHRGCLFVVWRNQALLLFAFFSIKISGFSLVILLNHHSDKNLRLL